MKGALRSFARITLVEQVNQYFEFGAIEKVITRFVGQWEWCVELQRADQQPSIFLEFGPTALVENERVPVPLDDPDYSRVFVTVQDPSRESIARIVQTGVSLSEVLDGLARDDHRLRHAVLELARGV